MDWNKVSVTPQSTIIEVMGLIDRESSAIALVVDENSKLLGTITDGDVRRGVLRGLQIQDRVQLIMNVDPIVVEAHLSDEKILKLMKKHKITRIPVVDQQRKVTGIKTLEELSEVAHEKQNEVVLMAGGLGSRLGELTQDCPKPMLKIGDRPILQIILENFISQGFRKFAVSVNYKSEMIESYFGDGEKWNVQIRYLKEDKRLGTAGSLSLLNSSSKLPVIVMNGDLLTNVNFKSLLDHHGRSSKSATMGVRQYDFQVPYGVVEVNGDQIVRIQEKPVHSFFVSAGVYILNREVIAGLRKDEMIDMPHLLEKLISANKQVGVFPIHEYWLDIGRPDDFIKANTDYLSKN